MPGVSDYELSQIDAVLGQPPPADERRVEPGLALVMVPLMAERERVVRTAVEPALRANRLNVGGLRIVFDDETPVPIVADWVGRAEVIVVDVSDLNAAVLYALGLCHGLRRCPLLMARSPVELPFELGVLRCLRYRTDRESLLELREDLKRALRIFLTAARRGGGGETTSDEGVA